MHFKISIVLNFNCVLLLLRMCFIEEKTSFNLNDIIEIKNIFIIICINIDKRNF